MKRKGFTLVEILAVILVIAVILAIIVPNISNFVLQRQNDNFITAARSLSRELVYDNLEYTSFSVSKLRDIGIYNLDSNVYDIDNSIAYVSDGEIYLNLVGKGEFEGLYICGIKYQSKNISVQSEECQEVELSYVDFTYDLDGGVTTQEFKASYAQGTQITMLPPTKDGFTFAGWQVTNGNSIVHGNRIIIGTTSTSVKALWTTHPNFILNLNGGTTTQRFETSYPGGMQMTLIDPTKSNNVFNGWTSIGGIVSGSNFTMGNTETTLTANWLVITTLTVNLNGGTTTQNFASRYTEGQVVALTNPTRTGYTFSGWTVSSGTISGSSWTVGNEYTTTLTANWAVNSYTLTLVNSNATTTGSTSVSVEYDGTPSGIINPEREYTVTYATGSSGASISKASDTVTYTFDGWYTQETGGTKVINVDGTLVSNVSGYTSSDGKWAKAENTELYAHWTGGGSVTTATITRTGYSCSYGTVGSNESYTPTSSVTLTAQCSANSYTCDAGKYLKAGETTCSSCPAGSYCEGGSLTYSDSSDVGKTACQAGKYTNATGQSSCTACAAGSYAAGTGNTGCTVCANGKTTSSTGATAASSCTDCSNKAGVSTWITPTWSANSVSNSCTINACLAGYSLSNNACTACSNNSHVATWSSGCTIATCASGYNLVSNACVISNPYGSYHCANSNAGSAPYAFTYTGNCTRMGTSDNWWFKFTSSGTLTTIGSLPAQFFLVGGGGQGGVYSITSNCTGAYPNGTYYYPGCVQGGAGGAGGGTKTVSATLTNGTNYVITIGQGGHCGNTCDTHVASTATSISNINGASAAGGAKGGGGARNSNGAAGVYGFGSSTYGRYAGAGGGGCTLSSDYDGVCYSGSGGSGGSGGGASGCASDNGANVSYPHAAANTGGGGGGSSAWCTGAGGSGIVLMRKN